MLVLMLVLAVMSFILFEFKARDLVAITVDNELEIIAQNSMDEAVTEVLSTFVTDYSELVITDVADEAQISSLRTDSVKINVLKNCLDDPRAIAEVIAERTRSQVVHVIGKKIVLYKANKDNPKIVLPK